jgi:type II secretory pathway pseudopilin PulG
MPSKGVFYGTVTILVALLLISSTFALLYYNRYQQEITQNQRYVGELNSALASYRALSGSFDSSLRDYNTTLSLLVAAVANLNTSTPAYRSASVAISSLWNSFRELAAVSGKEVLTYGAHMLVDYGNGTRHWYNETTIEPGWNAYVVTLVLLGGNVQATWYPQYGEHFLTGINGVSATASKSWFVWEYGKGGWTASQTGADGIQTHNGTTIAWTLCSYDVSFNPTCKP